MVRLHAVPGMARLGVDDLDGPAQPGPTLQPAVLQAIQAMHKRYFDRSR